MGTTISNGKHVLGDRTLKYTFSSAYNARGDPMKAEKMTETELLKKYFMHGIFFSVLMDVIAIGWVVLLVFLVGFGFYIGLTIGLALLFIFMGAVNAFVTSNVWNVRMHANWGSDLVHGFFLFLVLFVISLPATAIGNFLLPSTNPASVFVKFAVQTIILAFVYGFAAKAVAGTWIE